MATVSQSVIQAARVLGDVARAQGRPRVPVQDPQIGSLVVGLPVGDGAALVYQAFLNGWDARNLRMRT